MVLLKNDRGALPLDRTRHTTLAVIGADATEARLGGYSGPGIANVSMLDGIRQKAGTSVVVRYAPGPGRTTREFVVIPADALSSVAERRHRRRAVG